MRRFLSLSACLAAAVAAAGTAAAAIGWYATWNGKPPITVRVSGQAALPTEQQARFAAAMADWSLSPSVDLVVGNGMVKLEVDTRCEVACVIVNYSRGRIHGATLHFNPAIFAWPDSQWVYCHELGNALGLAEGYPVEQTGDYGSCMAGSLPDGGLHPSQMDYDVLAAIYPVVATAQEKP